ncbi:uncharacterized protein DMENIID0001_019930 [Sergentomyia squamirostris]
MIKGIKVRLHRMSAVSQCLISVFSGRDFNNIVTNMKAVLIFVILALSTIDASTIYLSSPYSYVLSNPYTFTYPYYTTDTRVVVNHDTRHHRPGHEGQDTQSNGEHEREEDDRPHGPEPTTQRPPLPLLYHWNPYSVVPASIALPSASQYHSQDQLGQYHYGYANPHSAKSELKTADGVTRGAYSYVDSHGKLQSVNYVSDTQGFRVAATNLPKATPLVDSPENNAARQEHLQAHWDAIDRFSNHHHHHQHSNDAHTSDHHQHEQQPHHPQEPEIDRRLNTNGNMEQ